jgi:hypothetical protein
MLAQTVTLLQLVGLAVVFAGEALWPAIGMEQPEVLRRAADNKFGTCMAIWFLGNMVTSALATTNAFEIYADGQLVRGGLGGLRAAAAGWLAGWMDGWLAGGTGGCLAGRLRRVDGLAAPPAGRRPSRPSGRP